MRLLAARKGLIMKISYPEMIIFDYGQTLLHDRGWDNLRGRMELFKHIKKNPLNVTAEEFNKTFDMVYDRVMELEKREGCDISSEVADKTAAALLNIEFDITPLELQIVFWNAASKGGVMPGADKMLDFLNEKGIRTGVISNLHWSGEALKNRFARLLPNNRFEFIITSCDFMFRKPSRVLFDIALNKAGLHPEKVWFCGDSQTADVEGASSAGIFPVWYDNDLSDLDTKERSYTPRCEHLHINNWSEMIKILDKL